MARMIGLVLSASAVIACFPGTATAQRTDAEAIPGSPFGVAVFTYTANPDELPPLLTERSGRAYYPAFTAGGLLRRLASDLTSAAEDGPQTRTVHFLFTGDDPLELTLHGSTPTTFTLRPAPQPPRTQSRLMQRWWRAYNDSANELIRDGDYPPLVQVYLTSMLEARMGLRAPLLTRLTQETSNDWENLANVLLGTERLHHTMLRETMQAARVAEVADQPPPADIEWVEPQYTFDELPRVEPMAGHVPVECFYVRFGTFDNYLWLENLLTTYGGDIGRMVTSRGQTDGSGDRVRRQLSLPMTALAKLLGGTLISDVALIGRDFYVKEGGAVGVLFQARNSTLLSVSINQQRQATLAAEKPNGATLTTVQIGGRDVSYLSTPDNTVRSFYAVDGDYHLVTTSRAMIERFFEAGDGKGNLASSPEFQDARLRMPLEREDTIFAFLSTSFFGGLLSPQYQIELRRRTQALIDLELVRLAQLAAAAEGQPAETTEDLIAGQFLPAGFGKQPDGSGPIIEPTRALDSLRGARGTFVPVPDVEITGVTATERNRFEALSQTYLSKWEQLDPLVVAIRRETLEGKRERLTMEANVSPIAEEKYGRYLSVLGPPLTQYVVPRAGDIVSAQAHVTGGQFSNIIPPHLLFVGIQDMPVPPQGGRSGFLETLRMLQTTPGYVGAWPKPGFLDWLLLQPGAPPGEGLTRLPLGAWRWESGGFSVVSFQREVLDQVIPQLQFADAPDPAQIRVEIGDLSQSQLRDWIDEMYFRRAYDTSVANAQLLHALTQQLRVPVDQSRVVTEQLLDTQLTCPLGGKYEMMPTADGSMQWRSTAWRTLAEDPTLTDYESPLLQWFRGMNFALTKVGNQLTIRTEIEMQR